MATKRQIAEQILRIVNGGGISDDAKVTLQEVGVLMEHERDALARKTFMENATIGENEIPNEFLSVRTLTVRNDTTGTYGRGRPYVVLDQMPINLPNDGGIYKVCKRDDGYARSLTDTYVITPPDVPASSSTPFSAYFMFSLKTGTHNIGRKFSISFSHGQSDTTLRKYQFTFDYVDYDSQQTQNTLSEYNLKPMWIVYSLLKNSDFVDFLESNKLSIHPQDMISLNRFVFQSNDLNQSFGPTGDSNMSIKSVLTNEEIIDFTPNANPGNATSWAEMTTDVSPEFTFGMTIYYPKNNNLYGMDADTLGVKAKNSTILNCYIDISLSEMHMTDGYGVTENYDSDGDGVNDATYNGIRSVHLVKMWINKFGSILKQYGITAQVGAAAPGVIAISETFALGGIHHVLGTSTLPGADGASNTVTYTQSPGPSRRANYRQLDCYFRMPNPGVYSNMYDSAIALSGRKYWYRQQGGSDSATHEVTSGVAAPLSSPRLYFYNEEADFGLEVGDAKRGAHSQVSVWMIAKSGQLGWRDQFPIPSDAISEMITSLVATFTSMRAAKEDLTNDNVDIT